MLCMIKLKDSILTHSKSTMWVMDVPDALFMQHVAVYGVFTPSSVTDGELQQCTWVGRLSDLEYVGPYEPKEKK